MSDGDGYARITLRIPVGTHASLSSAARDRSHSLNAEIVDRLERRSEAPATSDDLVAEAMRLADAMKLSSPDRRLKALRLQLTLAEMAVKATDELRFDLSDEEFARYAFAINLQKFALSMYLTREIERLEGDAG